MRKIINMLKRIFWSLPITPGFKERLRLKYVTLKDKNEYRQSEVIELSSRFDKDAYIKQILTLPNDRGNDYTEYIGHGNPDFSTHIIAYYLTQYHPNPQNDEWWGRGTTEWTNVSKAVPQYVGHFQPRLPGELGYYDLRLVENFQRQIDLAHNYGIKAFCFYYYWFDGKRLLETPLDLFLKEKQLDINFCICWANENWTKKFTGSNVDILMKVGETRESYISIIFDILDLFNDMRYYCIDRKPVLLIYRPSMIPDCKYVALEWKKIVKEYIHKTLYLVAVQEKGDKKNWCDYGFDAETEFQPKRVNDIAKDITDEMFFLNTNFNGTVYDYNDLVKNKKNIIQANTLKKVYPAVMPMWDNTARRNSSGIIYHGANPELYGEWLNSSIEMVRENSTDKDIVFINAWNEWGEGTYLEPDRKNGYAYLEKTFQILKQAENKEDESISID